jgi:hypothetical protein
VTVVKNNAELKFFSDILTLLITFFNILIKDFQVSDGFDSFEVFFINKKNDTRKKRACQFRGEFLVSENFLAFQLFAPPFHSIVRAFSNHYPMAVGEGSNFQLPF